MSSPSEEHYQRQMNGALFTRLAGRGTFVSHAPWPEDAETILVTTPHDDERLFIPLVLKQTKALGENLYEVSIHSTARHFHHESYRNTDAVEVSSPVASGSLKVDEFIDGAIEANGSSDEVLKAADYLSTVAFRAGMFGASTLGEWVALLIGFEIGLGRNNQASPLPFRGMNQFFNADEHCWPGVATLRALGERKPQHSLIKGEVTEVIGESIAMMWEYLEERGGIPELPQRTPES